MKDLEKLVKEIKAMETKALRIKMIADLLLWGVILVLIIIFVSSLAK